MVNFIRSAAALAFMASTVGKTILDTFSFGCQERKEKGRRMMKWREDLSYHGATPYISFGESVYR